MRVRNAKIICCLKTPSLSSCKQIREAINAFIQKENIKLGPQGRRNPPGDRNNREPFGKALGVVEQLATMKAAKYIASEGTRFAKCMCMNRSQRNRFNF